MERDDHERRELRRFGANVRRIAEARGQSLNETIRRAGLASPAVYASLDGRGNPTLRTLSRLAWALGVDASALLAPTPDEGEPERA